jgi:hypothetical protein
MKARVTKLATHSLPLAGLLLSVDVRRTESVSEDLSREAPALIEGEDFYREGGYVVFTAAYHLRRGHCCESGCRHCPYRVAAERAAVVEKERDDEASL